MPSPFPIKVATTEAAARKATPKRPQAGPPPANANAESPTDALNHWVGDPRFMQSLARGLLALNAVAAGEGRPVSASEISAQTGLSIATVRRCMYTLHAIGYVRANRNGAVPGPALAALTANYSASPLISGCGPILDALHDELGMTISLAAFEGGQPTIVASSTSESLLKVDLAIGASIPVHCSSAGKVYLASLSEEALAHRLNTLEFKTYTAHTITSAAPLKEQLVEVRRRGFAMIDQELVIGIRSVSAPVRDTRGAVVGSVNATMLVPAVSLRDLRARVAPAVVRTAQQLSVLIT